MKIRTKWLACVLVVLGCGTETKDESSSVAVSRGELTASCPTQPTTYRRGVRLYPTNSANASTVYLQDPTNPKFFLAYGFDIRKNLCAFFIRGVVLTDLGMMQAEVGENVASIENNNPTSLDSTVVTQTGRVPVPPFPGGTEQLAHKMATRVFNAATAPY